jgi:mono/diheme cytochrome c family protein
MEASRLTKRPGKNGTAGAHCHGEDGKGGVNLARRVLDAKGVFVSIVDGRKKNGIRMPAWREVLTDQKIWEATAYVLSISQTSR